MRDGQPIAFTIPELSKRLGIPASSLRIHISEGRLACDQYNKEGQAFDPIVSRDAAIAFAVSIGLSPSRLS